MYGRGLETQKQTQSDMGLGIFRNLIGNLLVYLKGLKHSRSHNLPAKLLVPSRNGRYESDAVEVCRDMFSIPDAQVEVARKIRKKRCHQQKCTRSDTQPRQGSAYPGYESMAIWLMTVVC